MIRRLPAALLPLLLIAASTAAQDLSAAHMEGCLIWNRSGNVSVRNECSRPIALMFMDVGDQHVVTTELAPGERFTSEAVWGQTSGFIFTACPIGSRPSVRFALENKETIGVSLYNCLVGRPSS